MDKEELKQIIHLDSRIDSKLRQLEELKLTRESIQGIDYTKDKVQTPIINQMENTIIRIISHEESINKDINNLVDMKNRAREKINKVDGVYGTLLEMRYLECMRWEEIAYRLNYSIRQVYRMHGEALLKIKDGSSWQ